MMQDEIMPPIVAPVATCTTQLTSGGARMTLYRPPAAADATTKRAKSWSLWSVLRVNLKASALVPPMSLKSFWRSANSSNAGVLPA
jgi:hypothetical protein